jgi:hypothetical protein
MTRDKLHSSEILTAYLDSCDKIPTIIIDEFNRFLIDAEYKADQKQELSQFLQLIVKVTKESNKCKIIIASSEYDN